MRNVARLLLATIGWSLILLGLVSVLLYPVGLWWHGRVLANEVRALDGFEIINQDDRSLSLLQTSGMGRVTLADLTVRPTVESRSTPSDDLKRSLLRSGRRVNEQQARNDAMDADVIRLVSENVDDGTVQVRLELHDSDLIGLHVLLFSVTIGLVTVAVGRVVLFFARRQNPAVEDTR